MAGDKGYKKSSDGSTDIKRGDAVSSIKRIHGSTMGHAGASTGSSMGGMPFKRVATTTKKGGEKKQVGC